MVDKETLEANKEKEKCNRIAVTVQHIKEDAQKVLDEAEPLLPRLLQRLTISQKKILEKLKVCRFHLKELMMSLKQSWFCSPKLTLQSKQPKAAGSKIYLGKVCEKRC